MKSVKEKATVGALNAATVRGMVTSAGTAQTRSTTKEMEEVKEESPAKKEATQVTWDSIMGARD